MSVAKSIRWLRWLAWSAAGLALLGIAAGAVAWLRLAPRPGMEDELRDRLARQTADHRSLELARPPWTSGAPPGDAFDEQRRLSAPFAKRPLGPLEDFGERLMAGTLEPFWFELAVRHAGTLDAVERTLGMHGGRCQGISAEGGDLRAQRWAIRLLLADALLKRGSACVTRGVSALRLAQDLARGSGLMGKAFEHALTVDAARVVAACAANADNDTLVAALTAVRRLSTSSPEIGVALEHEVLSLATAWQASLTAAHALPWRESLAERRALLSAWDAATDDLGALRSISTQPDFMEANRQVTRAAIRIAAASPVGAVVGEAWRPMMTREGTRIAYLRMLTLVLESHIVREKGDMPQRPRHDEPSFSDPFTGRAFQSRAGSFLASAGPDSTLGTADDFGLSAE